MRRVGLFVLPAVAALSALSTGPARAQPAPAAHVAARGALAAGLEAADASNYAEAEKTLMAIQGADRPAALLGVARIRFEQGRFADADRLAQQASASPDLRLGAPSRSGARSSRRRARSTRPSGSSRPARTARGVGGRRVRLVLGELLIRAGRRADAEPVLLKFADEYGSDAISSSDAEGLAMVGRAMHLLRHPKDANRAFNESERAERAASGETPTRRDAPLARRALLRQLRPRPRRGGAHRGAQDRPARRRRERAARAGEARRGVRLRRRREARDAKRWRSNPQAHRRVRGARRHRAPRRGPRRGQRGASTPGSPSIPNDLELLSLRAAARFLADDKPGFEAAKRDVFARNKEFSQAYAHHRRLRRVGAPLRRRRRDDEGGRRARPAGRQGVGAARPDADARRRRDRRACKSLEECVEGRPLQRPRLQHAREALHAAGSRSSYDERPGGHLQRPLPQGREGRSSSATCRACSARRGAR